MKMFHDQVSTRQKRSLPVLSCYHTKEHPIHFVVCLFVCFSYYYNCYVKTGKERERERDVHTY